MKTVKTPIKTLIEVKRPNGDVEHVVFSRPAITSAQFEQVKKATKDAGRGEVLSYKTEYRTSKVMTSKKEMLAASMDRTVENAMTLNGSSY